MNSEHETHKNDANGDNDDLPVGKVFTRREAMTMLGGSTAGLVALLVGGNGKQPLSQVQAAKPATGCVARPALTEGPYFVDERLRRSDIRTDPSDNTPCPGVPLTLTLNVLKVGDGCAPIHGAMVDLWHCDALGRYSDFGQENTLGKKFLRGYQITDVNGQVTFTTIYPGWYQGRAVHLHFKIRSATRGQNYELTSQLFFDEETTDRIHARQPYANKGTRTLRNNGDGIFRQAGSQMILPVTASGDGYAATYNIGLTVS